MHERRATQFHLIDYAPIDGMWDFTISKADICQAMVFMIQQLVNLLLENNILTEKSPQIEMENAGFGLEYGIQTAEDYAYLFSQLYDPYNKVKIGWDINHLLHALDVDEKEECAYFMLPEGEKTFSMKELENKYGGNARELAVKWLEHNILHPAVVSKTGAVQLSDCVMKTEEFFTKGKLNEPYYSKILALQSWEEKENYGVSIVLSQYDSHEILGEGILEAGTICRLLEKLQQVQPAVVLLHELKNSTGMTETVRGNICSKWLLNHEIFSWLVKNTFRAYSCLKD